MIQFQDAKLHEECPDRFMPDGGMAKSTTSCNCTVLGELSTWPGGRSNLRLQVFVAFKIVRMTKSTLFATRSFTAKRCKYSMFSCCFPDTVKCSTVPTVMFLCFSGYNRGCMIALCMRPCWHLSFSSNGKTARLKHGRYPQMSLQLCFPFGLEKW